MANWNDYKKHVRETNPEISKDLDEIEATSQIVGAMIERRHDLNLSQRDLAELCGIPHSSVARIREDNNLFRQRYYTAVIRQRYGQGVRNWAGRPERM